MRWDTAPVGYLAHIVAGQSPVSDDVNSIELGDLPFVQGNAEFQKREPEPKYACDVAPKVAPAGSLLLSVRAPVGELNETPKRLGIGRGLVALQPHPAVLDKGFAWWAVLAARRDLHAVATGSTYPAVTATDVSAWRLPVPPLEVQRRIADFLDTETARIDTLLATNHHAATLVKERLQREMLETVGDWRCVAATTLGRLGARVLTGPFGTVLSAGEYVQGGIPLVNPSHIRDGIIAPEEGVGVTPATASRLRRYQLRPGDLVIGRKGDVGRSAIVTPDQAGWLCGSDSLVLRGTRQVSMEWIAKLTQVDLYRQQLAAMSSGATMMSLNEPTLLAFQVPLTAPESQQQQTTACQQARATARQQGALLRRQRTLLTERRQALITAAVTGELEV